MLIDKNLNKDINKFIESNDYMSSENKVITLINNVIEDTKEFEAFKKEVENREFIDKFTPEQLSKIKDLLKF